MRLGLLQVELPLRPNHQPVVHFEPGPNHFVLPPAALELSPGVPRRLIDRSLQVDHLRCCIYRVRFRTRAAGWQAVLANLLIADPEIIAKLNRDVQEKHLKLFPNSFKEYDYASVLEATRSFLDKEECWSFVAYFQEEPGGNDGSQSQCFGYLFMLPLSCIARKCKNKFFALIFINNIFHDHPLN